MPLYYLKDWTRDQTNVLYLNNLKQNYKLIKYWEKSLLYVNDIYFSWSFIKKVQLVVE